MSSLLVGSPTESKAVSQEGIIQGYRKAQVSTELQNYHNTMGTIFT